MPLCRRKDTLFKRDVDLEVYILFYNTKYIFQCHNLSHLQDDVTDPKQMFCFYPLPPYYTP